MYYMLYKLYYRTIKALGEYEIKRNVKKRQWIS